MSARAIFFGVLIAGSANAQPHDAAIGTFEPPGKPIWVGEVFDLNFGWRVDWDVFQNLDGPMTWTSAPLVAEPWKEPSLSLLSSSGGRSWAAIRFQTRAMALKPGPVSLAPVRQAMILKTGTVRMSEYERAVTESVPFTGQSARLEVRPLAAPPPDFSGAVGRFTLRSTIEPKSIQAGETLSWTLTLSGVGNWPQLRGLPARQAPRDFDLNGQPELKDLPGGSMFERSMQEKVELIPRRGGRYQLGPVEMRVFDPALGRYVRVSAPAQTIDVRPGTGETSDPRADSAATDVQNGREPLPEFMSGTGRAIVPFPSFAWRTVLVSPFLMLAALWLSLAYVRARRLDPERQARGAHARLKATLDRLAHSQDSAERRALVRSWQQDITLRCKLGRAAPIPTSFLAQPILGQLWAEAEDFLYGRSTMLSQDWLERAEQFWAGQGAPPSFMPTTTFRKENLYPLAAALMLFAIMPALALAADTQPRSETIFRQKVDRTPYDWKARYNLALNLAHQQRWDEAAGHAGIAWVQHPASETRHLWSRAAQESGYVTAREGGIPAPSGWGQIASSFASPAWWQWIVVSFVLLATIGGLIRLLVLFGHVRGPMNTASSVMMTAGAIGVLIGLVLLNNYRFVVDRDAALIWRATPLRALPVDTPADAAPQLPAGIVGRVDGHFLDWRRIQLNDGRSGWLRAGNLIWVWGRPADGAG